MKLSIIIVNYNTKDLLKQCLRSLEGSIQVGEEVIVVDNASSDGSVEMVISSFPRVKLIINNANLGFAKANNIALMQTDADYVLLLNPDTVVLPETLKVMLDFMDKNLDVGASTCRVEKLDGSLDLACRRSFPNIRNSLYKFCGLGKLFPSNKAFNSYNLTYLDEDIPCEVDSIVGAFFLVRNKVVKQIGTLDEAFFMYGEDIDWCYRIKQAGWKIFYYPVVKIIHYKGESSKKKSYKMIIEFHRAMHVFYKKHYAKKKIFLLNLLVYSGISLRCLLSLILNFFKSEKKVC